MKRFLDFKGEIPQLGDSLLPETCAQIAQDLKLWSGLLVPIKDSLAVDTPTKPGTIGTIYRWGSTPGGDKIGVITGATQANPVVITSVAHELANGERVFVSGVAGMTQINNLTFTTAGVTANTFQLSGVNGTAYGAYASGGTWVKQNGFWFHWAGDVDVARGPIPGDTVERTYYADGTQPRMTYSPIATSGGGTDYPNNSYYLGVPKPATAPIATLIGTPTCDAALRRDIAYVMTYVSALGEEGPPSDASNIILDVCDGNQIDLSSLPTGPGGNYNITLKRLYRANTSSSGTEFQFLVELAAATATYSDTVLDGNLGEVLPTDGWDPPPADMRGLVAVANGIMAGFSKNDLCLSVPFQPHAWPVDYRKPTDFPIVGIGTFENSVVICTRENPYIATGTHPATMITSMRKVNIRQGCVSKPSIVSLGAAGVAYASADGLVVVGPGGVNVISDAVFSRDEWQALNPSSIIGVMWDSRYYGFYTTTGGTTGGFYLDPQNLDRGVVFLSFAPTARWQDPLTDTLYLMLGAQIKQFDYGPGKLTYTWRSKLHITPPFAATAAQVIAASYSNLIFRYRADKGGGSGMELITQHTVTNQKPFRLAGGKFKAQRWEIEITGTDIVDQIVIGESVQELG